TTPLLNPSNRIFNVQRRNASFSNGASSSSPMDLTEAAILTLTASTRMSQLPELCVFCMMSLPYLSASNGTTYQGQEYQSSSASVLPFRNLFANPPFVVEPNDWALNVVGYP